MSVVPTTTPVGIALAEADPSIFPEPLDMTKLLAATPLNVLLSALIILFVRVWVAAIKVTVPAESGKSILTSEAGLAAPILVLKLVPEE